MTRINVGVLPSELCDQHLLAEIRELPRCFVYNAEKAPKEFTLGKGHILWCAKYHGSLHARLENLWTEASHRGFKIVEREPKGIGGERGEYYKHWTVNDNIYARDIVIDRIMTRMASMVRKPRWTNRQPPDWEWLHHLLLL